MITKLNLTYERDFYNTTPVKSGIAPGNRHLFDWCNAQWLSLLEAGLFGPVAIMMCFYLC